MATSSRSAASPSSSSAPRMPQLAHADFASLSAAASTHSAQPVAKSSSSVAATCQPWLQLRHLPGQGSAESSGFFA